MCKRYVISKFPQLPHRKGREWRPSIQPAGYPSGECMYPLSVFSSEPAYFFHTCRCSHVATSDVRVPILSPYHVASLDGIPCAAFFHRICI